MAERDIARESNGHSGIAFKPTMDLQSEEILRGEHRVGNLLWQEGNIRVSWVHGMSNRNLTTLAELEDIVDEAHRIRDALRPDAEDISWAQRSVGDLEPRTPQS